jgi:hypothetical protein
MALLLALILFFLTLIMSCLRAARSALILLAGVVGLAAYPVLCLWNRWFWMRLERTSFFSLGLECGVSVVAAVMFFFYRPSRRIKWLAAGGLAVHFCIWIVASGGFGYAVELAQAYGLAYGGSWVVLFESLLLPILSVLACMSWGAFVSNAQDKMVSTAS